MKTIIITPILSLLMSFASLAESHVSLRMEAKIEGKASYAKGKAEGKTQTRNIEVEITNWRDQEVSKALVRWSIYGQSMKDNALVVIKDGEETTKVPSNDKIVVTTPEVSMKGNSEYAVTSKSKGKGGGKSRNKTTKVAASGEEYYGYGVEILVDGKIVASYYSKPTIEEDMNPKPE